MNKSEIDLKKSPAHLELLWKFRLPNNPVDILGSPEWAKVWEYVLKENPKQAIKRLLDEKYIIKADFAGLLDYKFKLTELKELCKKYVLPVSGKKADLISRLLESHSNEMSKLVTNLTVYVCSESGHLLLEPYMRFKEEERSQAENKVIEALKAKNFKLASLTVIEFERKQVFQRGMGMDWNTVKPEEFSESLKALFSSKPKILADFPENKIEPFKIAAALGFLWGTGKPKVQDVVERVSSKYENNTVAQMFLMWTLSKKNLDSYKASKVLKAVKVSSFEDACEECKKLSGREFRFADVVELPYHKCTSKNGCRCFYTPILKY